MPNLILEGSKSSNVFYIHQFSAFSGRSYVIGFILLFLSWKIFAIAGNLPTYLDIAFIIISFLLSIPLIYYVNFSRFDLYNVTKVALTITIFLIPMIYLRYVIQFLPFKLENTLMQVYANFSGIFLHTYLPFILSGLTIIFGLLILSGVSQSKWVTRLRIIDDAIIKEQLDPYLKMIEVDISSVNDVKITQSAVQRRFDFALVTLVSKNGNVDLGVFEKPLKFKELIMDRIRVIRETELKKQVPYNAFIKQTLTEKSTCHICEEKLLDLEKPSKLMLCPNCKTKFHELCLRNWLKDSGTCPVCKVPLKPINAI